MEAGNRTRCKQGEPVVEAPRELEQRADGPEAISHCRVDYERRLVWFASARYSLEARAPEHFVVVDEDGNEAGVLRMSAGGTSWSSPLARRVMLLWVAACLEQGRDPWFDATPKSER